MPDEEVREAPPVGARHEPHEIPFDLHGILLPREPEPLRETADVRVDDDSLRLAELRRDHIRRLPRHAGQPDQLFQPIRNLAVELLERNPDVRARAAPVISYLADPRSTPVLLALLEDGQWFVRLHSVRALAKRKFLSQAPQVARSHPSLAPVRLE